MITLFNDMCLFVGGSGEHRTPMALWARAQSLPPEALQQVRAIYTDRFPIEVRHFLASWIEEKMWYVNSIHFIMCFPKPFYQGSLVQLKIYFRNCESDIDNPQFEQYAANIVGELIHQLEIKANSMNSEELLITKYKLMDSANLFKVCESFHSVRPEVLGCFNVSPHLSFCPQQRYARCPLDLFRLMRHCLNSELQVIRQVENVSSGIWYKEMISWSTCSL